MPRVKLCLRTEVLVVDLVGFLVFLPQLLDLLFLLLLRLLFLLLHFFIKLGFPVSLLIFGFFEGEVHHSVLLFPVVPQLVLHQVVGHRPQQQNSHCCAQNGNQNRVVVLDPEATVILELELALHEVREPDQVVQLLAVHGCQYDVYELIYIE